MARVQASLVDDRRIFLGADSDELLARNDRVRDRCHLSSFGLRKLAVAYAEAIAKVRTKFRPPGRASESGT